MEVVENEKPDELDVAPMPGLMASDQIFIFLAIVIELSIFLFLALSFEFKKVFCQGINCFFVAFGHLYNLAMQRFLIHIK